MFPSWEQLPSVTKEPYSGVWTGRDEGCSQIAGVSGVAFPKKAHHCQIANGSSSPTQDTHELLGSQGCGQSQLVCNMRCGWCWGTTHRPTTGLRPDQGARSHQGQSSLWCGSPQCGQAGKLLARVSVLAHSQSPCIRIMVSQASISTPWAPTQAFPWGAQTGQSAPQVISIITALDIGVFTLPGVRPSI